MARTSRHLVVDGSNIATEGRTLPSLVQLDEAVRAVQAEDPDRQITVIVDATFAHRIDDSERKAFEDASDNGEILTPPAGAVGRGDAFILQVADKANAAVLSNDSFQEFHGDHPWLFDEDRLIGGKPVEGVGWIFVARVPVRGPASRRATREAGKATKRSRGGGRSAKKSSDRSHASQEAKGPPPVPSSDTPPPARRGRGRGRGASKDSANGEGSSSPSAKKATAKKRPAGRGKDEGKSKAKGKGKDEAKGKSRGRARAEAGESNKGGDRRSRSRNLEELNSRANFLRFVTQWSIGDEVEAVVERYSSHGCYVGAAGAQCYLPSSAMGDPPPSRARDVVSIGQTAIVRVESLDSDRRGINVELVRTVEGDGSAQQNPPKGRSRRRANTRTSQRSASIADTSAGEANPTRSDTTVATKKSAKKATKKSSKKPPARGAKKVPAKATTSVRAAKATARKSAKKTPAKKTAAKRSAKKATRKTAKKAPAKKAPAKTAKKATKKAAPKKTAAKRSAKKATRKTAKKAPARKAPAKKTAKTAKKATKKAAPKKTTAKRSAKKTAKTARKATKKTAKKTTRKSSKRAAKRR